MKDWQDFWTVFLIFGMLAFFYFTTSGCAGAKIKNEIKNDLDEIAKIENCQEMCHALRLYIRAKLGM